MHVELSVLDYIVVGVYILIMVGISLFLGNFVKDLGSYLKGSNSVPWLMSGISNFMARCSTFIFVAYAGIAYEDGLVSIIVLWSTVPACIFASVFLAKRWRRAQIISPLEYLETRFNVSVHQISTWSGLLMRLLDNMIRLYAIGIFLCAVTPLTIVQSVVIIGILVVIFTIMGGLWSATVLSTIQFVGLIFITIILLPLSLNEVGGLSGIAEIHPMHINPVNGQKGFPLWLIAYYVMITIKYNSSWTFIQRQYCVKDEKSAVKVGILTGILFLIFSIVFLLPAVAARVMFPDIADKEMSYIVVSAKLLPSGLMGFMIASLLSTTIFTLNAEYNAISSVLTKDIYSKLLKKRFDEQKGLRIAHISTIIVGGIVLFGSLFVSDVGGVFEANKLFTGILAIPVGIPLILGLLLKKPDSRSALATILLGSFVGIVLNAFPDEVLPWEIATIISTITCILLFILWPQHSTIAYKTRINSFFRKISSPIPLNEIPQIDAQLQTAIYRIFTLSFLLCGIFFILISANSLNTDSGQYSLIAGFVSMVFAVFMNKVFRLTKKKT